MPGCQDAFCKHKLKSYFTLCVPVLVLVEETTIFLPLLVLPRLFSPSVCLLLHWWTNILTVTLWRWSFPWYFPFTKSVSHVCFVSFLSPIMFTSELQSTVLCLALFLIACTAIELRAKLLACSTPIGWGKETSQTCCCNFHSPRSMMHCFVFVQCYRLRSSRVPRNPVTRFSSRK